MSYGLCHCDELGYARCQCSAPGCSDNQLASVAIFPTRHGRREWPDDLVALRFNGAALHLLQEIEAFLSALTIATNYRHGTIGWQARALPLCKQGG